MFRGGKVAHPSIMARFLPLLILFAACSFWGWRTARADDDADDNDPPIVGRPADLPFSHAIGRFRVEAKAAPTVVEAEAPVVFTLTIEAVSSRVRRPPQRLDLKQLPAFADAFHIEDLGDRQPTPSSWELTYRLRPRRPDVSEVPGVPFVYFDPEVVPANKGYQVRYTEPIRLQVKPREIVAVPLAVPPGTLELATGPEVLAQRRPAVLPSPPLIFGVIVLPPLGCLAWYICWRRLNPDAARQAHYRRSRAARRALQRLADARASRPPEQAAAAIAAAVSEYLHERFDLITREPTPTEAHMLLLRNGLPRELAAKADRFYRDCDRGRFLPAHVAEVDLRASGEELVLDLEAASCSEPSS
jgi:hypothetical protein